MKNKNEQKTPLKWTLNSIKKQFPLVIALIVVQSLLACTGTASAVCSKYVIDSATAGNSEKLIMFALLLGFVYISTLVLGSLTTYITEKCNALIQLNMKSQFFSKITRKNYEDISGFHTGTLINRLTSDISVIAGCVTNALPKVFSTIVKLICAFVAIVSFEPWFAIVFGFGGAAIFFVTRFMRKTLKKLHKKVQEEDDKVRSFWQESLSNLLAVKVFSNEGNMTEKSLKLQNGLFNAKLKKAKFHAFTTASYSSAIYLSYLFAFFWCASRLFIKSVGFTYGTFTAIMQLVGQVQQPFTTMSGIIPQYYNAMASAERIMEIEDMDDEVVADEGFDVDKIYNSLKCIKIDNLGFAYKRDNDKVFDNLNFEIEKGDFAAIVGPSGIGKSTLFKIILGVYSPKEGSITLECEDQTYQCTGLTRKLFTFVPQGNMIFSGTIRENITFVNDNATPEQIDRVLKLSCADEFVNTLPDGIETVIGEKGLGLSEGQVQRLAIARALLSTAPIILLDEATSALDGVTEAKVLQNLRSLTDKTCLIVTHRKKALSVCNKKLEIKINND